MQKRSVNPWKRVAAVALTVSLLFCSAGDGSSDRHSVSEFSPILSAEAFTSGNYRVKTRGSNLNVRSGPGTGYATVRKLSNGTSFTVYETSGNWGKISSSASQWVCLTYSTYVGSSASAAATGGQTGTGSVYNCSALNVRSGPSTSYKVINTLRCGDGVNITSTSGNWGYDSYHSGYVSLKYIQYTGGSSNGGSFLNGFGSSNYTTVDTSRNYQLEPLCAGNKVVDVNGWGRDNNTNIQIWERGKTQENQTFQPISCGNGYYVLKDVNSGKVLDICGGNAYDGANVILYEYHGGANQQWRFIYKGKENGHNWYELESKVNGNYCLDVNGASSSNGANVQVWSRNGTSAQKFMMWYGRTSGSSGGGNSIIDGLTKGLSEIFVVNDTKGHSEFKPRQQKNYSDKWHSCGTRISSSGCGILATVNAVGYLTGKEIPIVEAAKYCGEKNLHLCGSGGKYQIPEAIVAKYGSQYGVTITKSFSYMSPYRSVKITTWNGSSYSSRVQEDFPNASSFDAMWSELTTRLQKGEVAVTLVPHHYIAIVAYDKSTNKVLVYDSAAGNSRGTSTNGTWVSKDQLNINSGVASPGIYTELKLRCGIVYIGRR